MAATGQGSGTGEARLEQLLAGDPDNAELSRRVLVEVAALMDCDAAGLRWIDPGAGFHDEVMVKLGAFDPEPAQRNAMLIGGALWVRFPGAARLEQVSPAPAWDLERHLSGPLGTGQTAWATLHLHRRSQSPEWRPAELAVFREYCLALALAVENRIMQALLRRELRALHALSAASGQWQAGWSSGAILENALDQALEFTGFSRGLALLETPPGGELRPAASRGVPPAEAAALDARPLVPYTHAGLLRALRQQSLNPADLDAHPPLAACFPKPVRSLVCLPLDVEGRFLGALILADGKPLGHAAAHLAQAVGPVLAAQAARTLHTTGLLRRLEARTKELERATADLTRAERRAALVKLAAAVAHQIRNPLSVVSAHVDLMRDRAGDDRAQAETLDLLEKKVGEANSTVQQLLELSRPLRLRVRPTDLGPLLDSFVRFIQPKCRLQAVELNCCVAEGLQRAWADETPLQRCLLDLCLNALQVLPRQGRLDVMAEARGDWIALSVSDDGPGIPAGIQATLFEPFSSGRAGGTGMGLYNVRRICQEMGAHPVAGNLESGGSRFCLYLRAESAARPVSGPEAEASDDHD